MIWWMTQNDLSLGEIMRIYPSEVADTSLTAVRFCNVMVIMQSVSDAASWWDEIALVIYPSTCVLGNKTWPHKFHTSLMVMRTQSPNHCHDSTAFDSRMPCNSSPFSTVLSGRSWLVPSGAASRIYKTWIIGGFSAGFASLIMWTSTFFNNCASSLWTLKTGLR